MKRALIVTVDAARARIFLYQEQAKPGFELTEYRDLTNPGRRMKPGEMFSESRPDAAQMGGLRRGVRGGDRSTFGTPGAPYDDHRIAHIEMMDTKFAKHVIETVTHVLQDKQLAHLILCAPPKMLGILRQQGGLDKQPQLLVEEIGSDLSNLSLAQLHDHLAQLGHIPGRARLAMAR